MDLKPTRIVSLQIHSKVYQRQIVGFISRTDAGSSPALATKKCNNAWHMMLGSAKVGHLSDGC